MTRMMMAAAKRTPGVSASVPVPIPGQEENPIPPNEFSTPQQPGAIGWETVAPTNGQELADYADGSTPLPPLPVLIELDPDNDYTHNGPIYFSPSVADGSNWIYVTTTGFLPTEKNRSVPAFAGRFPYLANTLTLSNAATVIVDKGCRKIRFIGLAISQDGWTLNQSGRTLVSVGRDRNMVNPNTFSGTEPEDIYFDRCVIYGPNNDTEVSNGIELNCIRGAVLDSSIWFIHDIRSAGARGIWMWNTKGPLKIDNCDVDTAGTNISTGGGDPLFSEAANLGDLAITHTICQLDPTKYWPDDPGYVQPISGQEYTVRNLLETTFCRGLKLDACWFRYQRVIDQPDSISMRVTNPSTIP